MTCSNIEDLCRGLPLLKNCGKPLKTDCAIDVHPVSGWVEAKEAFYDTGRDYLKVEAQGDLTGWLAKNAYDKYGCEWNKGVKEITAIVEPVTASVPLPFDLEAAFEGDLRGFLRSLIVLYAMQCRFSFLPRRPQFFDHTMTILCDGHFPCGCILPWPTKTILVY